MVIGSISTVLLPVFSRLEKGEGLSCDMITIWNSAMLKSAKILFPISVFSIFMAHLIMVCLYGNNYVGSSVYFQIKSIYGFFYIVPFAPVLISMGKTKVYSRVTMYFALFLTALEFLSVSIIDNPVAIAILSETCSIAKCIVFFAIIARFSSKRMKDLLPTRQLFAILCMSVLASIPVYFISKLFVWNKFVLLFFDISIFCVFYYVFCWIGKVTYRDIASSFFKNNKVGSFILKVVP